MLIVGAVHLVKNCAFEHLQQQWREQMLFLFRGGDVHGTGGGSLQLLKERATICADVLQAFDHVSPSTLAACLEF